MSESKSLLMPFIIIAILVFGGAVAWKFLGNKETVEAKTEVVETVKESVKKAPEEQEIIVKTYDEPEPMPVVLTEEERAEQKRISRNFMKFAMQYPNKESVEKGLAALKNSGNKEKFEYLALFAEDHYPDLEVPTFE